MQEVKNILKQIKWWEIAYLLILFVAQIVLAVIFDASAFVFFNSFFFILAIFFNAKGIFLGSVFGIVNTSLYLTMSYFNQYYGEMICSIVITLPSWLISLYTWFKNRNKATSIVKITPKISAKEWILLFVVAGVLSVGVYFLLREWNTANLVVSTISTVIGGMAGYLQIRRSEYNFLFYILVNIVCIVLWMSVVIKGDMSQILTIFVYVVITCLNIFGTINWFRLKKFQNEQNSDSMSKIMKIVKEKF